MEGRLLFVRFGFFNLQKSTMAILIFTIYSAIFLFCLYNLLREEYPQSERNGFDLVCGMMTTNIKDQYLAQPGQTMIITPQEVVHHHINRRAWRFLKKNQKKNNGKI
jgi:hypothetical protein